MVSFLDFGLLVSKLRDGAEHVRVSLTAAPHAGDDCSDASPDEDEAWR